jgi:Asp-tRNA(Asn)/Glu-tRNA(Gln) amidotransferase A subunit family amidase
VQSVVELFKERGAEVELVDFPGDFATVLAAHWTILRVDKAAAHEALFAEHMDEYGPHTRSLVETGLLIPAVAYSRSLRIQRKFTNDAQALVAGFDALLAPSAAAPAPRPTDLLRTGDHSLQMPWSFSGLPAICLPSGLSGDGMPFSIQFIGAPFTEERLLATAQWGERALGVELLPPLE